MQSRNALSNLKNRYLSVLKKCALLNVFGSLAVASMMTLNAPLAQAAINDVDGTIFGTIANDDILLNNATLIGANISLPSSSGSSPATVAMYGNDSSSAHSYKFTNSKTGVIDINSTQRVFALYGFAQSGDFALTNQGSINIQSTNVGNVYGLYTLSAGNHSLFNDTGAKLSISSSGATYGMRTDRDGNNTFTNKGIMQIEGRYTSFGMNALSKGNHTFTNDTDANMTVKSTTDYAYGMYASANSTIGNTFINKGTMNIEAEKYSYGMFSGGTGNHIFTNDTGASITVKSKTAIAYGIYAFTNATTGHILTNKGTMNIEGVNVSQGMLARGTGNHTFTNDTDANITVKSTTNSAYGMHANENATTGNKFTNKGTMNIEAYLKAYGMTAGGAGSHTFTNDTGARLIVKSTANAAYGMETTNFNANSTFTNKGIMEIDGTEDSYGMHAARGDNIFINDIGASMTVKSIDKKSVYGMYASASAPKGNTFINDGTMLLEGKFFSYGMYANASGAHSFTNNGTMTVKAINNNSTTSFARSAGILSRGENSTLSNTGTIVVEALASDVTSHDATAYGMQVAANSTVHNTGYIKATASSTNTSVTRAYEVYGDGDYNVGTWATTLRDWTINDSVFAADSGVSVKLANSTLLFRPGAVADGFYIGKEYSLTNLVVIDGVASLPQLGTVSTEVPFLKANLGGTASAPTVSLAVVEENFPNGTLSNKNVSTALTQMGNISQSLNKVIIDTYLNANYSETVAHSEQGLAAGSATAMNKWTVFATPYASISDNSKYDYNSNAFGITAGMSYNFTPDFALGMHLDFNKTDSDDNNIGHDATTFALGLHSNYFFNKNWYISGNATFAFGDNSADYTIDTEKTSDDYSSNSFFAAANIGYIYEINENNVIVPELGLSYIYANSDDYDFNFTNPAYSTYNMNINKHDYNALYANLMLTWKGSYQLSSGYISPKVGLGIRQNITGTDIDSALDIFDTNYKTEVSSDSTSFLVNTGLEWTYGNFTLGAFYDASFGSEQQNHTGTIKFVYAF